MTSIQTVGIFDAATRLNDDYEAISRARAAQCHQLRVLHHIHIRFLFHTNSSIQPCTCLQLTMWLWINLYKLHCGRDSAGYGSFPGTGEHPGASGGGAPRGQIQGRGFSGQPAEGTDNVVWGKPSEYDKDSELRQGSQIRLANNQDARSGTESGKHSRKSRTDNKASRTAVKRTSSSTGSESWSAFRDLMLLYAVVGVTGLIIYLMLFHYHSSSGWFGTEGTYDAVIWNNCPCASLLLANLPVTQLWLRSQEWHLMFYINR